MELQGYLPITRPPRSGLIDSLPWGEDMLRKVSIETSQEKAREIIKNFILLKLEKKGLE